jgi:hypothetical protein
MELSGQLHASAALPPGKEFGWAPKPVWTLWRREKFLPLPGLESPIMQPVAQRYIIELSRLLLIYWEKIKGKIIPVLFLTEHLVMKVYWGSGGIASRILNLGTRWS